MNSRDRQIGESYKDYAARMAGDARAAEIDRDCALAALAALAALTALHPPQTPRPDDKRTLVVAALAKRYKPNATPYDPDVPADKICSTTFRASDGYLSIRALTFGEVADVAVAALVAPSETDGGEHREPVGLEQLPITPAVPRSGHRSDYIHGAEQ